MSLIGMKRLERLLLFLRIFPTWRPVAKLEWVKRPEPGYFGRVRDFAGIHEVMDAPQKCPMCTASTEVRWPLWFRSWRCSNEECRWPHSRPDGQPHVRASTADATA